MEPPDGSGFQRRTEARTVVAKTAVLVVTFALVLSTAAPLAAGAVVQEAPTQVDEAGQSTALDGSVQAQVDETPATEQWTDPPGKLEQVQEDGTVDEEKREAAEEGVDEAVETLQRQGVSVNQSQRAAAVNGTVAAVTQYQNASVEQIQNASYGAVGGTFLQSQNVTVEQVQNATFGGASGALSQHQNASATQLQHAAHGATHGAVAQHQNASIEQVQIVAQGAAAGAAHEAGKRDRNESKEKAHPGAIREAAQGAAFGAMMQDQRVTVEQRQTVTVEQRQYAAAGAAEGALNQTQTVTVEQTQTVTIGGNQTASVKQIQVAAMGAAKGSLSITQRQNVTVRQVQSAARGACKGALTQVQEVSITQIQESSFGAAKGAISQSQSASVTQIQAAATGGAQGAITQRQSVSITQVQHAAAGAAKGAARSAAQRQVVNVEQIQAAAAGAGQGSIVQIQQINIVQIQIISQSAADGALSQHQEASVTQIQSAARGASEGATALTQRQEVNVEQTQIITRDAAADTAATAAQLNIEVEQTIYDYAKGASENPDDEDDDQLRSLFVSAEQDGVFLANPNDVAVTVTITSEGGDAETVTLSPGESTTVERDRGTYTLTAETADGEDVEVDSRDELTVSVGDELQSLTASVEDQSLVVENRNDERVTVDVSGDLDTSFDVPGDWEERQELGPGTYTATAETTDGEDVQINGEDAFEFTIESEEQPLEEPNETDTPDEPVTPNETDTPDEPVTPNETDTPDEPVTPNETDTPTEIATPNETEQPNETDVPLETAEPVDVNVTVGPGNISFDNPSETAVTVTATDENDSEQTVDVPGGENVTAAFDPGTYTLTGESEDDREVRLDNESELTVEVPEPAADVVSLNVSVDGQNVSFDNPGEVAVTVTATDENDSEQTVDVPGGENVTEEFDPGNYTLTGESEDDREVLLNDQSTLTIQIEEPPEAVESLNVTVDDQNVTVENPNDVPVTVAANSSEAENRTLDVAPESNVTAAFDPGNYTLTAETADGTTVPVNGETEHEITVEAAEPEATGTLTVDDQTGDGTEFAVANASATVPFVVEIDYDAGTVVTEEFGADETLENATLSLDPPIDSDGTVTVTVRAAETDASLANETVEYDVAEPFANVTMADQTTDGTSVVVQHANLTEGGFLAIHEDATNGTDDVLGTSEFLPAGEYENVTVELEEQLTADASVIVTAHQDTNDNQAFDFAATDSAADGPYVDDAGVPISDSVLLTLEDDTPDRELDSCTVIDEPGAYELTADVQNQSTNACLEIASSDVILDGNGNAVRGSTTSDDTADTLGVEVYDPEGEEIENVTVRNLAAESWDVGVSVGNFSDDQPAAARLENLAANDNRVQGVSLVNADGTVADNVTANRNGNGILIWETQDLAFETINASENGNTGLSFSSDVTDSEFTDVTAVANGEDGVYTSELVGANTFTALFLADNGDAGIEFSESGDNVVRDSVIEENGEVGVRVTMTSTQTLENVTVSGHSGPEVEAGVPDADPSAITATDLALDPVASFDATEEPVTLDLVDSEALPALPENATAIQDGVSATGIENSVDATIEFDETQTDGEIELWRHDGTEWTSVETVDAAQAAGSYDTTLTEDGVYALVEVEEEAEPAAFNASELDPATTTVTQGDLLDVSATIENVGDEAGTQTVELRIDGAVLAEQQLQLESGQTAIVTFEGIDTGALEPGTHEYAIVTEEDEVNGTLTVEEATPTPEEETATPDEPSSPTPVGPPVGGTQETETPESTPTPDVTLNGGNESA